MRWKIRAKGVEMRYGVLSTEKSQFGIKMQRGRVGGGWEREGGEGEREIEKSIPQPPAAQLVGTRWKR